jgi:hypothetical protein
VSTPTIAPTPFPPPPWLTPPPPPPPPPAQPNRNRTYAIGLAVAAALIPLIALGWFVVSAPPKAATPVATHTAVVDAGIVNINGDIP